MSSDTSTEKVQIPTVNKVSSMISETYNNVYKVEIAVATKDRQGIVQIGDGINVSNGVISADTGLSNIVNTTTEDGTTKYTIKDDTISSNIARKTDIYDEAEEPLYSAVGHTHTTSEITNFPKNIVTATYEEKIPSYLIDNLSVSKIYDFPTNLAYKSDIYDNDGTGDCLYTKTGHTLYMSMGQKFAAPG